MVLDWTISGLIIAEILKQRSGFLQSDKMITRLVVYVHPSHPHLSLTDVSSLSIEAQIIPSLG